MSLTALEWSPAIAVGVDIIDKQHQELFTLVNKLVAAFSSGKSKEEIGNALKFLQDYVVDHFGMEEKYMLTHKYHGYDAHKAQHTKFIDEFLGMKKTYETEGASLKLAMEVQRRVGDWLLTHIKRTDKELAEFLKGKI